MKQNVSLAMLLLACCISVAGCAGGASTQAACAIGWRGPEPSRAAPGEAFRVHGEGFAADCHDAGQAGRPSPQRDIPIEFRQGERTWRLATVDADRDGTLDARLEVPGDAGEGDATVVARPEDGQPVESPFRVLAAEAGAGQGPSGTSSSERVVASGQLAACAGGGEALADLVVEGTVERVEVRGDHSLSRVRVERVLEGSAGETVTVRTNSGARTGDEHDPGFEEGARYKLYLRRQGDAYATDICLGTRRVG